MMYNNYIYNGLLVGDLYHWELDPSGYFIVKENTSKTDFQTLNVSDIIEDIQG